MRLSKRLILGGAVLALAFLFGTTAHAGWITKASGQRPPPHTMVPKTPTRLTAGAAGEVNYTATEYGSCLNFECDKDFAFLAGASTSVPVASATAGNRLTAQTVRVVCMPLAWNYLSLYISAAGECRVSELSGP